MKICVGICTWNRARLLEKTLRQMTRLRVPSDCDWEVLVVNNRCTDDTDDVIDRFRNRLPLRRLYEEQSGKSFALNAAIRTVESDWILWTDDDVLVQPDWIEAHYRGLQQYPDADFFGGVIEPDFEIDPPDWILEHFQLIETAYAVRMLGDEPFQIDLDTLPFGANFSIRTDLQKKYLYDTQLGRVGANHVRGEETALAQCLLKDGYRGYWNPYSRVRHFIPRERLSRKFLRDFFYGIGQTVVLMNDKKKFSLSRRLRYLASAAQCELGYQTRRRVQSSRDWVRPMVRASYRWGRVAAAAQRNRDRHVA